MTETLAPTWPEVFTTLLSGADLQPAEAAWAMGRIMSGEATPVQISGFLVALRAKGVTTAELVGIADVMLDHARQIAVPGESLDIVGTGGDRAGTVNISTMAAIVSAAAGMTVVKHGNRAASSRSGTADCLEALGVALSLGPDGVVEVAEEVGITFCFAQDFHPSMRHAAVTRRELGVPTVFNILGPLTNPARPTYSAVGVADLAMAPLVAGVFAARGKDAAVFRGGDGLDEVTVSTTTQLWWVRDGAVTADVLDPAELGVPYHPLETLRGGDPAHNAQVVRDLVAGSPGPVRDAVVLNAGAALALTEAGAATSHDDIVRAVRAGMDRAARAIDTGAASATLAAWRHATAARAEQSAQHG